MYCNLGHFCRLKIFVLVKEYENKHTKYFHHTYYITECKLNSCTVQKLLSTNILHTNMS